MDKEKIDRHFLRTLRIQKECEKFAPASLRGVEDFRSDICGLILVSIAASYENCVKSILIDFSSRRHVDFEFFINKNFDRLNSRIAVNDLYRYTKLFGVRVHNEFTRSLGARKTRIENINGKNIESCYKEILNWRHDFAHAAVQNTTINEAMLFHRYARHVIYSFHDAFEI